MSDLDLISSDLRRQWEADCLPTTPQDWPPEVRKVLAFNYAASRAVHQGFDWPVSPDWAHAGDVTGHYAWSIYVDGVQVGNIVNFEGNGG